MILVLALLLVLLALGGWAVSSPAWLVLLIAVVLLLAYERNGAGW